MVKMSEGKIITGAISAVVVAILALLIVGGSIYTVDQGERGVILRNGAVVGTADPGLGFKLPLIDSVKEINVQTQARLYEQVMVYSRDQQTAELTVSVNYRLPADQVEVVYSDFGGQTGIVSRLLDRQVPENVKNIFGRFNAVTAIQERGRLTFEIQEAIQSAVKGPMIVESVQIENIDFSDAYEASIEQRMLAEVEVQKVQQNAEREKVQAEIKVIQAQAEADARVAQAEAEAKAIRLRGEAEAQAIRVRGQALAQNPGLVNLVAAENWDGKLPSTMIPGAAVPFINVDKK
jgi:regulator of protease activity HflC (stomatin/prohibitin superfamily)